MACDVHGKECAQRGHEPQKIADPSESRRHRRALLDAVDLLASPAPSLPGSLKTGSVVDAPVEGDFDAERPFGVATELQGEDAGCN